jgi:hypothetical protein
LILFFVCGCKVTIEIGNLSSKMVTPCYLTFVDVGKWVWVRWLGVMEKFS